MPDIEANNQIITPSIHHIFIIEDQNSRKIIYLEKERYTIGRHANNDIVVESITVSGCHATILKCKDIQTKQDFYRILDGALDGDLAHRKSNNGLFINDQRCLVHQLKDGDIVCFGHEIKGSYHAVLKSSSNDKDKDKPDPIEVTQIIEGTKIEEDKPQENISNSLYDPLTNLASENLLNEYLHKALAQAKRIPTPVIIVIMILEVDSFENIKNYLGQSKANELLKSIAKKLESCLRSGDVISHGQEGQFTILLPGINNTDHAIKLAQRIFGIFKSSDFLEEHDVRVNSNIGIVIYPQDGQDKDNLLKRAKIALRRAKQKGDNEYGFFNQAMNNKIAKILQLEKLVYQALNQNQFSLHYQPRMNMRVGELTGLEALLRWQHPRLGLIYPYQFISLLETSNMMIPLGKWVLKTACSQLQNWYEKGLTFLPIAVNISFQEFYHPNFVKLVEEILQETGLKANLLELEITEKTLLDNTARSREILQDLKRLGVALSIDDFGVGRTSLPELKQLPVNNLKIAKSLVEELKSNPRDTSLISAALAWGNCFKLRVIAKGVETQQQLAVLRSLHYEEMQGYRFSHPLRTDEVATYLIQHTLPPSEEI